MVRLDPWSADFLDFTLWDPYCREVTLTSANSPHWGSQRLPGLLPVSHCPLSPRRWRGGQNVLRFPGKDQGPLLCSVPQLSSARGL